jgi:hypothetical protein
MQYSPRPKSNRLSLSSTSESKTSDGDFVDLCSVLGPDDDGSDRMGKPYMYLQSNELVQQWNRLILELLESEFPHVRPHPYTDASLQRMTIPAGVYTRSVSYGQIRLCRSYVAAGGQVFVLDPFEASTPAHFKHGDVELGVDNVCAACDNVHMEPNYYRELSGLFAYRPGFV